MSTDTSSYFTFEENWDIKIKGGESLPLAPTAWGVFRYPFCGLKRRPQRPLLYFYFLNFILLSTTFIF
ncbi:MAG: hypothetical protein IJS09_05895 [Treponema sp.]|nr:hypothetical protein [Treponema sp.]